MLTSTASMWWDDNSSHDVSMNLLHECTCACRLVSYPDPPPLHFYYNKNGGEVGLGTRLRAVCARASKNGGRKHTSASRIRTLVPRDRNGTKHELRSWNNNHHNLGI